MYIAYAQVNPTTGDLDGNAAHMLECAQHAAHEGTELIVFPSLALTGGPLAGLGRDEAFLADALSHLQRLTHELPVPALVQCFIDVAAFPYSADGPDYHERAMQTPVASALFIVGNDELQLLYAPQFESEGACPLVRVAGKMLAVLLDGHYNQGIRVEGAEALVEMTCDAYTEEHAARAALGHITSYLQLARACDAPIMYVNVCGASDTTVFAGNSMVFAPDGRMLHASEVDEEDLYVLDTRQRKGVAGGAGTAKREPEEVIWRGIVTATRDYVRKNGFGDVLVGLSGGIDSSIVATVAVDALGAEHVHGLLMPGPYSSEGSVDDAAQLARTLGIDTRTISIEGPLESFHDVLAAACGGGVEGLAAENLQARIRAVYLMTLANAHGWLVLNTGNKSEAAMGFSTLGGDTMGSFAPLGQMYKSDDYGLAAWRMRQSPCIPQACLDKAPSAELYPEARDDDRLPPYETLDKLLYDYIEGHMSAAQLVENGHDATLVGEVLLTLTRNEFKRRLEPLGPKVMGISLNDDRAWPVTNAWHDVCR